MPLNTAAQNPNTFDVIPARVDLGMARGSCSFFELPTAGNTFGDTIQVVDLNMQVYTWNGSAWINPVGSTSAPVTLSADYTVTAADDGVIFNCTAALTITTPAGLSPKPSFIPVPPPTGDLSLAFTGGATGNGSAATQTRTRANNPAGVVVIPYADVTNGYGVSGS